MSSNRYVGDVTAIEPPLGPSSGGTLVRLYGHNLDAAVVVRFRFDALEHVDVKAVVVDGGVEIECMSPPAMDGVPSLLVDLQVGFRADGPRGTASHDAQDLPATASSRIAERRIFVKTGKQFRYYVQLAAERACPRAGPCVGGFPLSLGLLPMAGVESRTLRQHGARPGRWLDQTRIGGELTVTFTSATTGEQRGFVKGRDVWADVVPEPDSGQSGYSGRGGTSGGSSYSPFSSVSC